MEQATVLVKVSERNPDIGQTSNGKAKLGIKTDSGKWLQLTSPDYSLLQQIKTGQQLVVSEPRQFGKSWFADFKGIQGAQVPASNNGAAAPRFDDKPVKMTWDEFDRTVRAAHALIMDCEPDGYKDVGGEVTEATGEAHTMSFVVIDRSQARAAILNTIIIALTRDGGRIEPIEAVPF